MKSKTANLIPLIATSIVPTATLTSVLTPPPALGATGDLDPGFGDVGRLGPILYGHAWSLEPLANGSMLLGGGNYYYDWYYYDTFLTNFVALVTSTGAVDPGFRETFLSDFEVLDIVRQSAGQVVAVGRKLDTRDDRSQLGVFRLQIDGRLDTTFGTNGVFTLPVPGVDDFDRGMSAVLDPDGRVVIAGSRAGRLIVLRLMQDGSVDNSFGTLGIFTGPAIHDPPGTDPGARTSILRTEAGAYRVTASHAAGCQIIALTTVGVIDTTFGVLGVVTVGTPAGPAAYCSSMVSQPDGRLLVAGSAAGQGFAARMLANGEQDASFSAAAVSATMTQATAVAAGTDGSVVVAGTGISGATIMRLQASGELDALFGRSGSTLIDIRSELGPESAVHDMSVGADGSVLAAGGNHGSGGAFVARLLGAGGGQSPGVLGITEQSFISTAEGGDVVVNVRRTGGADGSVTVAYRTTEDPAMTTAYRATAGEDFGNASGLLTWGDGDIAEKQIRVPIMSDNPVERPEAFLVALSDSQGGAGLGTSGVTVTIAADGSPFGQVNFGQNVYDTTEIGGSRVWVTRSYYSSGAVSVTVTPIAGTATAGADFVATPITLTWADGELGTKFADFRIVNDMLEEPTEEFSLQMSNLTGGAVLGPQSTATVQIRAPRPPPPPPPPPSGGGGAFGFLSLIVLGLLRMMRQLVAGRSTI